MAQRGRGMLYLGESAPGCAPLYSDLFNTVFVHIPKTGGQSIACVFLDKHGLAWKMRERLLMRKRETGEKGPARLAHLYAREYVECGYLEPQVFASCFKFAVVRDPYDRALSEYGYLSRKREIDHREFLGFLEQPDSERHFVPQSEFVVDGAGKVVVDHIIRFEALQAGFDMVAKRLFGREIPLPHVNRSPVIQPSDAFDAALRTAVYRRYEADFDAFRYPKGID